MHPIFWSPFGYRRMGFGPSLPKAKEYSQPHSLLGLSPCVGLPFLVSDSMCTLFICLCMWAIRQLVNPTTLSVPCSEGTGSTRRTLRPTAQHWLWQRDPLAIWCPLLKLILLCFFPVWVKCCSFQCLPASCFPWQPWYQDARGRSVQASTSSDE